MSCGILASACCMVTAHSEHSQGLPAMQCGGSHLPPPSPAHHLGNSQLICPLIIPPKCTTPSAVPWDALSAGDSPAWGKPVSLGLKSWFP